VPGAESKAVGDDREGGGASVREDEVVVSIGIEVGDGDGIESGRCARRDDRAGGEASGSTAGHRANAARARGDQDISVELVVAIEVTGHDPERRISDLARSSSGLHAAGDGAIAITFEEEQICAGRSIREDIEVSVTIGVTEGDARGLAIERVGIGDRSRECPVGLVDQDRYAG